MWWRPERRASSAVLVTWPVESEASFHAPACRADQSRQRAFVGFGRERFSHEVCRFDAPQRGRGTHGGECLLLVAPRVGRLSARSCASWYGIGGEIKILTTIRGGRGEPQLDQKRTAVACRIRAVQGANANKMRTSQGEIVSGDRRLMVPCKARWRAP